MSWEDDLLDEIAKQRKPARTSEVVAKRLAERRLEIEEARRCLINGLLHPQPTVPILRKIISMALSALPPER